MDSKILDELIIGRVDPHIYAFTTNTIPNYLKVGDTYRPVSVRLAEWMKYFPSLQKKFEETAKVDEEVFFRDYSIHQILENDMRKERLRRSDLPKGAKYSNEFFKGADANDVNTAIAIIKEDYESKTHLFRYYNALTNLPTSVRYSSTGVWTLRPNQEKTVKAFIKAIESGRTNLLMYAVMRFGKSFTSMCCAKEMGAKFVVIVSAKADVCDEWKKTIESADNFRNDYEFLTSEDLSRNFNIVKDILKKKSGRNKIALFLTLQDLQGAEIKDKHEQLFKTGIDLLIVDETHFGARAEQYGKVLRSMEFKGEKAHKFDDDDYVEYEEASEELKVLDAHVKLHLSGTPYRILMGGEFEKEDIIAFYQFSDIVQEQEKWDEENLSNDEIDEWENPYYGFPKMIRFAFNPNESSRKRLEQLRSYGITYAFSALLKPKAINKDDNDLHKKFIYEKEVLELLGSIDGSQNDQNILGFLDYDKIKEGKMCRHIVVVLPYCASCDALEALIIKNKNKFKNLNEYEIINISGVDRPAFYRNPQMIKNKIKQCENENIKTITLTVNRMLTGSTVEEWDTMIYLKDTASPQEYDQAIFRLQNQYIKEYCDEQGNIIKFNMKPQTLLVDFDPNRMFRMQEQKSQIYNVNVDEAGNSKLANRIKEELRISPIVVISNKKIKRVEETDIIAAVSEYSKNRGVAEETNEIPVDLSLINDETIWNVIKLENELGSKAGFETKSSKGDGEEIFTDDDADNIDYQDPDFDDFWGSESDDGCVEYENEDEELGSDDETQETAKNPEKQFRMYFARILYYAFLTKSEIISLEGLLLSLNDKENVRIFKNLKLNKRVIEELIQKMDKFMLRSLDYKIHNLNKLSQDKEVDELERALVANQKFGKLGDSQVVTPATITDGMINMFPKKYILSLVEEKGRILDIASKEGEFAISLCKRYEALNVPRKKISKLIYSIPTSSITYEFTRKIYEILDLDINNIAINFNSYDLLNIKTSTGDIDYERLKKVLGKNKPFNTIKLNDELRGNEKMLKFKSIVGNPPYQEIISKSSGNKSLGKQLFPSFIMTSAELAEDYVSLITPSKWFTSEGQDGSFPVLREYARNNNHFQEIHHFGVGKDIFEGVQLGAVNYFLYNKKYSGNTVFYNYMENDVDAQERPLFEEGVDIILSINSMVSILKKIKNHKGFKSMTEITKGRNAFGITGKEANTISKAKSFEGAYELRCAHEVIRYVKKSDITKNEDIADKWKIFTSKGNGAAGTLSDDGEVAILGKAYLGKPKSVCTDSLIPIGCFDKKSEAQNLQKYMCTKFLRFAVGVLKTSQNIYQVVYSYVPIQDFSSKSDIDWSKSVADIDKQLYKKYKFNKEEIEYIENKIKKIDL